MDGFDWVLEDASENSFKIVITFDQPHHFALKDEHQYMIVKADFSDFEPGIDPNTILARVQIPH